VLPLKQWASGKLRHQDWAGSQGRSIPKAHVLMFKNSRSVEVSPFDEHDHETTMQFTNTAFKDSDA